MNMKKIVLFIAAMLLATNSYAEDGSLKEVMQQLGSDYSDLGDAILWEDFDAAAEAAHAIAYHDKPSMGQRMKILGTLGTEMPEFKKADGKVHELAIKIEEAAMAKDMPMLIQHQSRMLTACMACHTTYRSRVIKALK
jgi:cytochrome c556